MVGRHEMLPNAAMGRNVHVWCYGSWGMPLVAFPTAAGFAHEWERQGMVEALAPLLGSGKIKLYCPESNIAECWTAKKGSLAHRIARHRAYEDFVLNTLVPYIKADCGGADQIPISAVGASMGAFYAVNFALKYPEVFRYALGMSGRYALTHFTDGVSNSDIYFNNPLAYVPGLEGAYLSRVCENTRISLVCGQGPYEEGCIEETIALADMFQAKGIPHIRDIWGREVAHDWGWWKRQARLHLGKEFG